MRVGGTFTMIMAGSGVMPEDVANRIGIPVQTVLNVMNGTHLDVPVTQLSNIAAALNAQLALAVVMPAQPKPNDAVPAIPTPPKADPSK
jgi:hypothetical protein